MPEAPGSADGPVGPSATARRVAAYRLGYERLAGSTGSGDPAADDRLAADVAGGLTVDRTTRMGRYLQARTRFFDRATVNALDRHVTQVVVVGAGYDGRALRYRTPDVRWWEVDRPATQDDKRSRLEALGVTTDGVTFVGLDLADAGLAEALTATGFEPDAPALFLAEGVVAYLDGATLGSLLADLRVLATPGTRLAASFGRPGAADPAERAGFEAHLAALGEPALGGVGGADPGPALAAGRWRAVELKERAAAAGFVVAAPVFEPPGPGGPATLGRIGRFVERMLHRRGGETLAAHLEAVYGVPVTGTRELDLGVHRVARADGTTWVARVFPGSRSPGAARADAELLDWLVGAGIPAERPAAPDPVSVHEGQPVLVTDFVAGRRPTAGAALGEELGAVLGRIHRLSGGPSSAERPGGAWHHLLLDAGVTDELVAATELVGDARHRVPPGQVAAYDRLRRAVADLVLPTDLPEAFAHPDLVARNVLRDGGGDLAVVDWAGAGTAPRIVSLACLLWSVAGDGATVDAVARGYRSAVTLRPVELDCLPAAMARRPAVLACWGFATGRQPVAEAAAFWSTQEGLIAGAAARARAALTA